MCFKKTDMVYRKLGGDVHGYGRVISVKETIKDTLWVLRHDEPLVHVSVDISLITKHILDYDISLES